MVPDSGRALASRAWGEEGRTVVALHGLADHGGVWGALAPGLAARFRVVAPDLPGHGASDGAAAYSADALADALEAWARVEGLGALHLLAHSWAARVALRWARQAPGRVAALCLVDPFFVQRLPALFRPTLPLLYRLLPFLQAAGPFADLEAAEALAKGLKQYRGWGPFQQQVFRESLVQDADGRWRGTFTPAARDGVFDDLLRTDALTESLPVLTWLLLPEGGLNRAAWQTAPFRRHLPALTHRRVPGNHWPHLTAPDALREVVLEWLGARAAAPMKPGSRLE